MGNFMRKLLILLIVGSVFGCSSGKTWQMSERLDRELSGTGQAGMEMMTMPNGRVCYYSSDDKAAAAYYDKRKTATARLGGDTSANTSAKEETGMPSQNTPQKIADDSDVISCKVHKDCPAGYACLDAPAVAGKININGKYIPVTKRMSSLSVCVDMVNRKCSSDVDCPDYEKCFGGRCAMCKTDTDCRYGYRCASGICQPKSGQPACEKATDCGNGEICAFGKCTSICSANTDAGERMTCRPQEVCQSRAGFGICVEASGATAYDAEDCLSDDDVELDSVCIGKKIFKKCQSDENCDEQCVDGICTEMYECSADNDCPQGLHCMNHACICTSDADCGTGYCSATHECVQCRTSEDCPDNQKCGYSRTYQNEEENISLQCLECMRNEDCGGDKPLCSPEGTCVAAECVTNSDCCYREECKDYICADDRWPVDDGYSYEEMVESSVHKLSSQMSCYRRETPCTKDDECDYDEACNQSLYLCKRLWPGEKLPEKALEPYLTALITNFCWRDNECPQGQVCNSTGTCGCSGDSCGTGYVCSPKFGCIPTDRSVCGNLEYIDFKCRCTNDAQCGDEKFCASHGACESLTDSHALYLEGLRWSDHYHARNADSIKAMAYLDKAIVLGNKDAMLAMLDVYETLYNHNSQLYDEQKHLRYFKMLEKKKNPEGLYRFGMYYMNLSNDNMTESQIRNAEKKGIDYLNQAANAGSKVAQAELAVIYGEGAIVSKDVNKAKRFAHKYLKYVPGMVRNADSDGRVYELLDSFEPESERDWTRMKK